jgi:hypothetical protein
MMTHLALFAYFAACAAAVVLICYQPTERR